MAGSRSEVPVPESGRLLLSRFVSVHRVGRRWVLESPCACARIELHPAALPRLARFAIPPGRPIRDGFDRLLARAGMLTPVDSRGRAGEDRDPALRLWEYADLLFHARSRLGRQDGPVGATWEHRGRLPPEPALAPGRDHRIALPARLPRARASQPLTRVLAARRSHRAARRLLSLAELGAFLYRSARVTARRAADTRLPYETTRRPYPSGGACYPLELYLVVQRCRGLERGIYHYDPGSHCLEPVAGGRRHVTPFFRDLRQSFGRFPPVLIVLTARFARVSWKYRAMAYSTILKEVGALMQTMYLVATDLRLAPCAIGCGDADRSARALGTRFETESSVGEFLLGGPPRGSARAG
jgi:SagB-type dehydrogenase family enzyme